MMLSFDIAPQCRTPVEHRGQPPQKQTARGACWLSWLQYQSFLHYIRSCEMQVRELRLLQYGLGWMVKARSAHSWLPQMQHLSDSRARGTQRWAPCARRLILGRSCLVTSAKGSTH